MGAKAQYRATGSRDEFKGKADVEMALPDGLFLDAEHQQNVGTSYCARNDVVS